ncbi:tRNA methyl transferase PRC-barrel domain-containing protein [Escherichia coli]
MKLVKHQEIITLLGQRKGLGIGEHQKKVQKPWYVVDKDVENNILSCG